MTTPLSVGLAGAGPWAAAVHAPMLAAGPETTLAGVWSRTPERARRLAEAHGVATFERFADLVDASEAVAFAVAPAAQPDLALVAAGAGRAVLLEKPLGLEVADARRLAAGVEAAGVGSIVVFTYRFNPVVRAFVEQAAGFDATGARACFLSGAFLEGPFAGGWRAEHGALLDVGPHLLDLAEAAMGPIETMVGRGNRDGWFGLVATHRSGAVSDLAICCSVRARPSRTEIELWGPSGTLAVDARVRSEEAWAVLRREFAETARRGGGHPVDARRGAQVQELVAAARRAVAAG